MEALLGDASKVHNKFGWAPPKINFAELVDEMVAADQRDAERDALVQGSGCQTYRFSE